ncbi:MAG TPA: phosphotriesterase [Ohtaekwangia sp.]|uniref:phosphotriesterase family protein n=1 Tax=Ohtaekwangia sp. TaxID=2066019 RepID=UPI002F94CC19
MNRRTFLQGTTILTGSVLMMPSVIMAQRKSDSLIGVQGPIKPNALGVTLIHEHIMADFIGAAETGTHRYNADQVVEKALPYLLELKKAGCNTFVDCTPVYLGRDARILKRLSQASGLNIFTTTGYYGAVQQKFLPAHAYTETAEQLSARWVKEFRQGIDDSGIFPGLIKTSVDEGPLPAVCQKILAAVALTHLQTGLSISAHTGNGEAALQELAILQKAGVHASAFRWVHAQLENDKAIHLRAANMGAWIEFDGINTAEPESIAKHIDFVKFMKEQKLLHKTLISQDAGWYWVGEPNGGNFRGYTGIFETFIPALRKEGFTENEIRQLLVDNPRESLTIKVRKT